MKSQFAARVDSNQPEIVKGLRRLGATVQHIHTVGRGCPDLLVGFRGCNSLLEIKTDRDSRLTADERKWHGAWEGQVDVVVDLQEAAAVVGIEQEVVTAYLEKRPLCGI